jgi:hypothetical protein
MIAAFRRQPVERSRGRPFRERGLVLFVAVPAFADTADGSASKESGAERTVGLRGVCAPS